MKLVQVGPVQTTHPKSGNRLLAAPPKPSARIKAILANGLQDIPKEAEVEARTLVEYKAELAKFRGQLTQAEKRAADAGIPEAEVARRIATVVREARQVAAPATLSVRHLRFLVDGRPFDRRSRL